ncbi:MAG: hypothetical protein ACT4PO_04585 [Actinomycetota bacterium]
MTVTALVLSILGVLLAVASLIWNYVQFRLSGPRITVRILRGVKSATAIARAAASASEADFDMLRDQGFTEELVGVEVSNVRRAATEVQQCDAEFGGFGFTVMQDPMNPTLPHRLEAQSSETWWVPLAPIRQMAAAARAVDGRDLRAVRMQVVITGREKLTTEAIEL